MKSAIAPLFALTLLISPFGASAAPVTINFDSLEDLEVLGTGLPGLTFLNATVLTSGISLNEFDFPPRSGPNVVFDDGGPMTISFAIPVYSVAGFFTYLAPLTLTAFDTGNNVLGSISTGFLSNLWSSGDPGSTPNELLEFTSATAIGSIVISGDSLGGTFVLDDLTLHVCRHSGYQHASYRTWL